MERKHVFTLALLCAGYFLDFYDLTIMGVNYVSVLSEKFHIIHTVDIQQAYLKICNYQTVGIFIGALLFGWLGDKIGRARAIQYCILLYSVATVAAVYAPTLGLFTFCRLVAYIGLAAEFSTSAVLIIEMFALKSAAWGTAILYSFGVCGGLLATFLGMWSWKVMFLFGGGAGFIVFLGRHYLQESEAYLQEKYLAVKASKLQNFGNFNILFKAPYRILLLKYFGMMLPYFAVISFMFLFPNAIMKHYTLETATQLLLLGFFIGNIVSSMGSGLFAQFVDDIRWFLGGCFLLFIVLMPCFPYISESNWALYSLGLGLLGGGYPILLIQKVGRDFPVPVRSIACNTLFALGRVSCIGFNVLLGLWMTHASWILYIQEACGLIFLIAIGCLFKLPKNLKHA